MKTLENFNTFQLTNEQTRQINGGSVPSNWDLMTGDYGTGSSTQEPELPVKRRRCRNWN